MIGGLTSLTQHDTPKEKKSRGPLATAVELVVGIARFSFLLLLLMLHLTPVDELGASDLLVDSSLEHFQVKELVLRTRVPELHRGQTWIGSILYVLTKKILCGRTVKNELSLTVMLVVARMEAAIMLEGFFVPNAPLEFLLHCLSVIFQALAELLEADAGKLRQVLVYGPGGLGRHLLLVCGKQTSFQVSHDDLLGRAA